MTNFTDRELIDEIHDRGLIKSMLEDMDLYDLQEVLDDYGCNDISYFSTEQLVDELDSRGEYNDRGDLEGVCKDLYDKRAAGKDVSSDIEQIFLKLANRIA